MTIQGGTKSGKITCHEAEKNHKDNACCKRGHIVERKIVVVAASSD
jgi:hypothetical protein